MPVAAPPADVTPLALPSSVLTSSSSLATFTPEAMCTVCVPAMSSVPAFLGSCSQRSGEMPSAESEDWSSLARLEEAEALAFS